MPSNPVTLYYGPLNRPTMPTTRRKSRTKRRNRSTPRKPSPTAPPDHVNTVGVAGDRNPGYVPTRLEQIHELLCREYEGQNLPDAEVARRALLGMRLLGFGQEKFDHINKKAHYNQSRFEVIEILDDHSLDFYRGNIVKYLLRAPFTDTPLEQLQKAKYYLDRLVRLTTLHQGPFGLMALNAALREGTQAAPAFLATEVKS